MSSCRAAGTAAPGRAARAPDAAASAWPGPRMNPARRRASVVVPVTVMLGVPVAVVDVVHVIVVRHGHVAAILSVLVVVAVVYGMLRVHTLVHVIAVRAMQVTVVRVVDVVLVRDCDVTAPRSMLMSVGGVGAVFRRGRHLRDSSWVPGCESESSVTQKPISALYRHIGYLIARSGGMAAGNTARAALAANRSFLSQPRQIGSPV
jgi:hypothetical protein